MAFAGIFRNSWCSDRLRAWGSGFAPAPATYAFDSYKELRLETYTTYACYKTPT